MNSEKPRNTNGSPPWRIGVWRTIWLSLLAKLGAALRKTGKHGARLERWALKGLGVWPID